MTLRTDTRSNGGTVIAITALFVAVSVGSFFLLDFLNGGQSAVTTNQLTSDLVTATDVDCQGRGRYLSEDGIAWRNVDEQSVATEAAQRDTVHLHDADMLYYYPAQQDALRDTGQLYDSYSTEKKPKLLYYYNPAQQDALRDTGQLYDSYSTGKKPKLLYYYHFLAMRTRKRLRKRLLSHIYNMTAHNP